MGRETVMEYEVWQIAVNGPWDDESFYAMSVAEANMFAKEFERATPERLAQLRRAIRSTHGFESWEADCSEGMFLALADWVTTVLALDEPRPGHITVLNPSLPESIKRDLEIQRPLVRDFVDRALARSLILDIGILVAECLRRAQPNLKWKRIPGTRDMDQNKPAITGHWLRFSPFQCKNLVMALVDGRATRRACWDMFLLYKEYSLRPPRVKPVPIAKREGTPVTTQCPKCGMSYGRVRVEDGTYCNHCGFLEVTQG